LDVFGNKVDEEYFVKCRNEYLFNYKGTLNRDELIKLLPEYDFLILPSLFTEMYPLVIQEAFNTQLPVIASAAKGNMDVIKEGKNGFIFNYGDHKDLARVIDEAYNMKQKGWQPQFDVISSSENDLQQILSYYKPDFIPSE
jgi:glycosyltransferase involved in cell wall biosynthesis